MMERHSEQPVLSLAKESEESRSPATDGFSLATARFFVATLLRMTDYQDQL
jgi:hypothetical protein